MNMNLVHANLITQHIVDQANIGEPVKIFNNIKDLDIHNYQLSCFVKLLENKKESPNLYNNNALLRDYKVIEYEKVLATTLIVNGLAKGRETVGDKDNLIRKYVSLLGVVGFLEFRPIIFDRNMRIIDGYQRYHACRILNISLWYVRLDVNLKSDDYDFCDDY
jgi:hypothetical protein